MQVLATAGHVDHGKSTLVRLLTGMEPDRWAEERRRGMTIDLGFAWTTLPSGARVAFVDVPGHERFVANMLAGVGPVPAAMFVVAADEGWKPQSEEHLQALDALGVEHGLLVVTKSDVGDAVTVAADVLERMAATTLRSVEHVVVSAPDGSGLDSLVAALDRLVGRLPAADPLAPVRLWVDRSFTIRGAGTVVTGTLAAGTLRVGDTLTLMPSGRPVTVRGLESCKERRDVVEPVARVAVNLRGTAPQQVRRGMALVTPAAWRAADRVDVVLGAPVQAQEVMAHLGSAAVPARVRPLGGHAARLRLAAALPLHVGDRILLRDPARHVVLARADVADLAPVRLARRGDAARLAAGLRLPVSADDLVRRHGFLAAGGLTAAGVPDRPGQAVRAGDWWVAADRWAAWREGLTDLVASAAADPLSPGLAVEAVQRALGLPSPDAAAALAAGCDGVVVDAGRVRSATVAPPDLPELAALAERFAADPFDAPEAAELAGVDRAVLAHGTRIGALLHLGGGVYVGSTAPAVAVKRLAGLEQPFTVSAARRELGSTRRVVVPLLEHLDATRRTRKLPDGTRMVVAPTG